MSALLGWGGAALAWGRSAILGLSPLAARLAVGAAALIGLWLWIGALRADNRELRAQTADLAARLAAIRAQSDARARAIEALEAALEADRHRADLFQQATEEARNVDPSENGGVAPVLERAFERLRRNGRVNGPTAH